MAIDMKRMSGEELLLLSVLGGPTAHEAIDRELDTRALFGPPAKPERKAYREESILRIHPAAPMVA